MSDGTGKLSLKTKIVYALPRLTCSLFSLHISSKARKYYTDGEPGISPTTLAMLVATLKCADLLVAMVVGYWSDNMQSKYGRRKPFIGVGAPLWCLSVIMLCLAPSGLSASAYVWYFGFFYFMYYSVGWTATNIPYDALAMELTTDYGERASLFGYKGMFQMVGYILWAGIGLAFASAYPNDVKAQVLIPALIFAAVVLAAFALLLFLIDEPNVVEQQAAAKESNDGLVPMVRRMFRNPLYINYLKFKAPASMAFEVPVSVVAYYVQYAVRDTNPNAVQSIVTAAVVGGAILAIPLVVKLTSKYEKSLVLFAFLFGYGCLLALTTFIPPSVAVVYVLGMSIGFAMGAYYVVPDTILGDCIDYDEFHSGRRAESSYTVIETNIQQFMEVPAYAVPFTIVGLAGYLANGGCGCGCGYGEEGCINAPLTTLVGNTSVTAWQSATIVESGDAGYDAALSCGGPEIYSRLELGDDDRCAPFLPSTGSFADSCKALSAADAPCTLNADGLTFSGDSSGFGKEHCSYVGGEAGTGPEAFCTYQPSVVRTLFIGFQCLVPGLIALLAAWPTYLYPLQRESHAKVVAGIAAHKRGEAAVDPLSGIEVPDPNSVFEPAARKRMAAYDHYGDGELRTALAVAQSGGDVGAALKSTVVRRMVAAVLTLLLLGVLVAVVAASSSNSDVVTGAVTFASLVGSITIFLLVFDYLRLSHCTATMMDPSSELLTREALEAHVAGFGQRTMTTANLQGLMIDTSVSDAAGAARAGEGQGKGQPPPPARIGSSGGQKAADDEGEEGEEEEETAQD